LTSKQENIVGSLDVGLCVLLGILLFFIAMNTYHRVYLTKKY
jgi:hypothetical protein